jgi:hypothetical protein
LSHATVISRLDIAAADFDAVVVGGHRRSKRAQPQEGQWLRLVKNCLYVVTFAAVAASGHGKDHDGGKGKQ